MPFYEVVAVRERKKERKEGRPLYYYLLPLSAHSLRSLRRSGVPGSGFPLCDSMSKPMLKEATPLELPEQGNRTLKTLMGHTKRTRSISLEREGDSALDHVVGEKELTFGFARDSAACFHRNGRRLQNVFVERLETIEMVIVFLVLPRFPREIDVAHLLQSLFSICRHSIVPGRNEKGKKRIRPHAKVGQQQQQQVIFITVGFLHQPTCRPPLPLASDERSVAVRWTI